MIDGDDASEEELEEMESDRYIGMPTRFDINEYGIMREFIDSLPENRFQDELYRAVRGRGAFRRFREVLRDYRM